MSTAVRGGCGWVVVYSYVDIQGNGGGMVVVVVMRKITANNNNNTDNLRSIDVEPGMYGWYGMVEWYGTYGMVPPS